MKNLTKITLFASVLTIITVSVIGMSNVQADTDEIKQHDTDKRFYWDK